MILHFIMEFVHVSNYHQLMGEENRRVVKVKVGIVISSLGSAIERLARESKAKRYKEDNSMIS